MRCGGRMRGVGESGRACAPSPRGAAHQDGGAVDEEGLEQRFLAVVERVGDTPALMVAQTISDSHDLVLSSRDAARLRVLSAGTSLLQRAPVVVVVKP